MKWLVWILIFGLVAGCATIPEHRPNCEPVPTTAGWVTGVGVGIMLMPVGLTIPWIMAATEKKALIRAYPECKDEKQGPAVRRCVKKIDIEEGRRQN